MKKKIAAVLATLAIMLSMTPMASAHEYDRDDSDMWLRYAAYVVHPIGIALEYAVGRPIHWLVSQPDVRIWFGHRATEDISYDYFEWE